ncbi:MAG: hypothetical protein WCL24_06540 [Verrucomicrobiota bacterium]
MKSFLHGKKTLSVSALQLPPAPAAVLTQSGAATAPKAPAEAARCATVKVMKEGDKVACLVITCACGERIEINCIYPVGS